MQLNFYSLHIVCPDTETTLLTPHMWNFGVFFNAEILTIFGTVCSTLGGGKVGIFPECGRISPPPTHCPNSLYASHDVCCLCLFWPVVEFYLTWNVYMYIGVLGSVCPPLMEESPLTVVGWDVRVCAKYISKTHVSFLYDDVCKF